MTKVALLVIDGLGVGALPDAAEFGDEGANTLAHAAAASPLRVPHLDRLGLGAVCPAPGLGSADPVGVYGRMVEASRGKDSMIGHWELAGVITAEPFPIYPDGFPSAIRAEIERTLGVPVIGNVAGSGTELVRRYGKESASSGCPILYTSADSVLQLAAHAEVVEPDVLYAWCEMLQMMMGDRVARVIARPFTGMPPDFKRLDDKRRDWSTPTPGPNLLDVLEDASLEAVALGKVLDLFGGVGFTSFEGHNSDDVTMELAAGWLHRIDAGLVWANCEDCDTKFGHRNDPSGWCRALSSLDDHIETITGVLSDDDVLIVVGDHGNDPTSTSTDHSREYVPVLATTGGRWRKGGAGVNLGVRSSFTDVAATIAELLTGDDAGLGNSFAEALN